MFISLTIQCVNVLCGVNTKISRVKTCKPIYVITSLLVSLKKRRYLLPTYCIIPNVQVHLQ